MSEQLAPVPETPFPDIPEDELPLSADRIALLGKAVTLAQRGMISSAQDMEKATDAISILDAGFKALEVLRKAKTDPLRAEVTVIGDWYKGFTQPLLLGRKILQQKMSTWRREEEDKRKAEETRLRKIQEDAALVEAQRLQSEADKLRAQQPAKAAELDTQAEHVVNEAADAPAPVLPETPKTYKGAYGGSSFEKKLAQFEVEDLARVPLEWMTLDEKKVRAAIRRAVDPVQEIPGLRIYKESNIQSRH